MRIGFALFLACFAITIETACGDGRGATIVRLRDSAHDVDHGNSTGSSQPEGTTPFRVGVAAITSPETTFETYQGVLDYLRLKLDSPIELVQRRTYAELNDLIRTGDVDLGFVCSGAYVNGHRRFGMELVAVPVVGGRANYYSYVIVPSQSAAQSIDDLGGAHFAFTDPLSNSGYLAPMWRLRLVNPTGGPFFSATEYTQSHENSIRGVAERLFDGAAVDSMVYDALVKRHPSLPSKIRVIGKLGPYANPPVVVNPDLDSHLKVRLRGLLLGMGSDPSGKPALDLLGVERYTTLLDSDYEPIRVMANVIYGWTTGANVQY